MKGAQFMGVVLQLDDFLSQWAVWTLPLLLCQLSAHDELAQIIDQQEKMNRGSCITQVPVLAQEGDVNMQGLCGEGRSEESLQWPAVKIRLIHFLTCHLRKKKSPTQTPKQTKPKQRSF